MVLEVKKSAFHTVAFAKQAMVCVKPVLQTMGGLV